MNRRRMIGGGAVIATFLALGLGLSDGRDAIGAGPDGKSAKGAFPLNSHHRVGDWTVAVHGRYPYVRPSPGIGVDLAVQYHGDQPESFLDHHRPVLLGLDSHINTQYDVESGNPLWDTVAAGARLRAMAWIDATKYDAEHPDDAFFLVAVYSGSSSIIDKLASYVYFSLDSRQP